MEKNIYIAPDTEIIHVNSEDIMLVASPGIGGDYDPSHPIDAKENRSFFEEEPTWKSYNPWDD